LSAGSTARKLGDQKDKELEIHWDDWWVQKLALQREMPREN
jgi:hypothetical protein